MEKLINKLLNKIIPKRCYVITTWYMGGNAGAGEETYITFLGHKLYKERLKDKSVSEIYRLPNLDKYKSVKNIPPELIPECCK